MDLDAMCVQLSFMVQKISRGLAGHVVGKSQVLTEDWSGICTGSKFDCISLVNVDVR